jgi:hypothetical protein
MNTQPENWKSRFRELFVSKFGEFTGSVKVLEAFIESLLAARDQEWVEKLEEAAFVPEFTPSEKVVTLRSLARIVQSNQINKQ